MSKKVGEYTRLVRNPWIQGVAMVRSSLWLGEEELLAVKNHGYVEHYQRFRYADIQAVVIRRTARRLLFGILLGLPGFGALLAATLLAETGEWVIFWGIFAGFFLLLFGINLVKGPGARATVKTAVGFHRLPAITRMRRAEEAAERLRLKIHEKQGELTEEEIAGREVVEDESFAGAGDEGGFTQAAPPPPLPMSGGYRGLSIVFLLITIQALLISLRFFVDSLVLDIAIFLPAPIAFILGCMVLPKWKRLPSAMRGWLLAALIYLGVLGISFYFGATILIELNFDMGRLRPVESTFWAVVHACFIAAAAVIGLGGFLGSLSLSRGDRATTPTRFGDAHDDGRVKPDEASGA